MPFELQLMQSVCLLLINSFFLRKNNIAFFLSSLIKLENSSEKVVTNTGKKISNKATIQ